MSKVHQYKIKPEVFEAIQWTGENSRAVHDFIMPDNQCVSSCDFFTETERGNLLVRTPLIPQPWQTCEVGDYVTKGHSVGIAVMREDQIDNYCYKIHVPIDDQEA